MSSRPGPGGVQTRRPAQLVGNRGRQRRGGQLRQVRRERHDAIVLVGIERHHVRADALQPRAEFARGRSVEFRGFVGRQDPGAAAEQIGIGRGGAALFLARHGMAAQELAAA